MRRKQTRTKLRPQPILLGLIVLNVAAGLMLSRVTALRKVRVDGCAVWDQERVQKLVNGLTGRPCALINRYEVESQAMWNPEVSSAKFDRSIFGSAVLDLRYRNPVARFYNHINMGLSSEGVVYRSEHFPDGLPTIQLGEGGPKAILTLSEDWPSSLIAVLAIKAKQLVPSQPIRIDYGNGSVVVLNVGAGRVELGDCSKLDAKMQALADQLKTDPDYLSKIKSLNLVDPANPMAVPK